MTIRCVGPGLTAQIAPERGAKVTSLKDDSGIEWLAEGCLERAGATRFVDAEMGGWDECAPTITSCIFDGVEIPDHGDLWGEAFEHTGAGTLQAHGRSLDYLVTRSIDPTPDGLLLTYVALARAKPIPFLWAAHPQFHAPPGTRVEIDEQVSKVIDVEDPNTPQVALTSALTTIDTVPDGGSRKWYVPADLPVSRVRLVRSGGAALEIAWSPRTPYLGVWFDNRRFSSIPVIAIEPSTGHFDSVERAASVGATAWLRPERPLSWWVSLRRVQAVLAAGPPAGAVYGAGG